jgi:hypothetical protein
MTGLTEAGGADARRSPATVENIRRIRGEFDANDPNEG